MIARLLLQTGSMADCQLIAQLNAYFYTVEVIDTLRTL